jgi:uncharacterized membrane protein YhaH (DUF805 family)
MDSPAIGSWIIIILIVFLYLFPVVKILHKAGYSGWWCILAFIPLVNLVMIWVFAFASWPNLRREGVGQ